MIRKNLLATIAVVLLVASPVAASSVTYSLLDGTSPNTFDLFATASEDSFGIAQYAVQITGAATIDHKSPVAAFAQGAGGAVGFNFARSQDNVAVVSASQSVTDPAAFLIYNIGKTAGDLNAAPIGPVFGASEGAQYGSPVLLASGTYTAEAVPTITTVDGLIFTNQQRAFARPTDTNPFTIINDVGGGGGVAPTALDDTHNSNMAVIMRQLAATGDPTITFGSLTPVSVTQLGTASLASDGKFTWQVGTTPQPGTYTWDFTATNSVGSDVGRVTINLEVPEPATMSLFGLAMIGLIGIVRRRS